MEEDFAEAMQTAFNRRGIGSAKIRAEDVDTIYKTVVPTLSEMVQELDLQAVYPLSAATLTSSIQQITEDQQHELTFQLMELIKQALHTSRARLIRM
jgi:hypothetical protein